ncbi:uncharacterized protein LOC144927612 isoform X2 [Branchiostoma floridae x Branchiostoma belcheri]
MGKYNGDATDRNETQHDDKGRLRLVLAVTVCLFVCSLLMNVLVYVYLTAAIADQTATIADLSRRLGDVEGRQDSHRSTVDTHPLDVKTATGQNDDILRDTDNSYQSLPQLSVRLHGSSLRRKRSGSCFNEYEYLCHNGFCIPTSWQCDGQNDCTDGSDEFPLNAKCYPSCRTYRCQNNGTCVHKDGVYTCKCTGGWGGKYCHKKIDHCEGHRCQNDATCRSNEVGYTCICTEGWRGKYCHQKKRLLRGQQRRGRHAYGLGSLLSVHIQAETDTSETGGTIPVTGNFTQWRDITETGFGLQNGQLKIKEAGRYFIYSQVYFGKELKHDHNAVAKYSIKKGRHLLLTCERPLTGVPPPLTCYTAGVLDLKRDDTLVIYVHTTGSPATIDTAQDATFWGAIKLSMDIPIEKRSRKRNKKGKT